MADENKDIKYYEEKYKSLLDNSRFEELETELKKPNIFNILGIGRTEIRHSNFLGWLLNPDESHGLGNKFLIRVLRDLSLETNNDLKIVKTNRLNFSNVEISRELFSKYGSIDLLIDFKDKDDKVVICIENKIDTTDFDDQLNRYENYINEKFKDYNVKVFVYLTPGGSKPKDINKHETWHCYSYKEIIKHLEDIQKAINDSTIKTYISAYLSTLNLEIMGIQGDAKELANAIYKEHYEIIDFVVNNRDINEKHQEYWERDENKEVLTLALKLKEVLKDTNKDTEYELGYTQNAITITQWIKNRFYNIYSIYPRGKDNSVNLEFSFSAKTNENPKQTKERVKEIVEKKKIENPKVDCSDFSYFKIFSIEQFDDKELQEIHEARVGLS